MIIRYLDPWGNVYTLAFELDVFSLIKGYWQPAMIIELVEFV